MIPVQSIISMVITLFLSLILPIVFLIIMQRGREGVFGIWFAGALGFLVSQMLIRIPIMQYFSAQAQVQQFIKAYPYIYVLILALSAALFESTGRLVVLKWVLGKRLSYTTGIISGAGHGGIESILLVGSTYAGNLYLSYIINTDKLASVITDPTIAESIRSSLVDTSSIMFLSAGFERLFTMVFHIALSVLFTYFIMKKRTALGFVTVAAMHFLVDFIAGVMMIIKIDILLVEGVIFIVALVSLLFIMKIKPRFGERLSK